MPTKARRIHTSAGNSSLLNLRLTRLLTVVQGVFTTAEGQGKPEAAVVAVGAGSQCRAEAVAAAAAIWQRYGGQLNLLTQQERNRRLKVLGQAVGLERECVEVIFTGKNRSEQVRPMW